MNSVIAKGAAVIMLSMGLFSSFGLLVRLPLKAWNRKGGPIWDRLSVENTGVEPVTSCMPCKRSSQLS
jgi:hypothetical protein